MRTIDEVPDELALMFQEAAGTGSFTLSPCCIKTSSHFAFGGKLSQVLSRAYGAFCCFSSALGGSPLTSRPPRLAGLGSPCGPREGGFASSTEAFV